MARFEADINVGQNVNMTYKIAATITDADVGKPVAAPATADVVALAADGDQIYGFIVSVEPGTTDGLKVVTVMIDGRIRAILSGASTVGAIVEAAANTAAGTAKAGNFGLVSTHTKIVSTVKCWRIISGAVTDGATVLLEKQ